MKSNLTSRENSIFCWIFKKFSNTFRASEKKNNRRDFHECSDCFSGATFKDWAFLSSQPSTQKPDTKASQKSSIFMRYRVLLAEKYSQMFTDSHVIARAFLGGWSKYFAATDSHVNILGHAREELRVLTTFTFVKCVNTNNYTLNTFFHDEERACRGSKFNKRASNIYRFCGTLKERKGNYKELRKERRVFVKLNMRNSCRRLSYSLVGSHFAAGTCWMALPLQ